MRARMQKDDGSLGGSSNVLLHALKVEADGFLVKVGVLLDLEAGVLRDRDVVSPCGGRKIDGFGSRVVAREEGRADPEGTRARDRLSDGDLKRI